MHRDQVHAAKAACNWGGWEWKDIFSFSIGFFSEHKCFLCPPDDAEPTECGNTNPGLCSSPELTGVAIPVLAVPQDHEKQQKLWFLKVQQVTAPDGAQTEAHFKA